MRWLRGALLVLAAALVWVAHYERWTPASWQVPTDYYVDATETLARLKAASEGDIVPLRSQVIERLGAPFGAHWNAYPTPDKPLMMALGALVRTIGLYATANVGLLLAHLLSAVAFYLVARRLGCRWEWAAAGALLFACTYHTVHRGLSHFSLVFTWTVPFGLLTAAWVASSRRIVWRSAAAVIALGTGAAMGFSNPYNLFFWLQLLAWAAFFQWCGPRRRANLQIGLAAAAISVAAFVIGHAEEWLHRDEPDGLPLLARNYAGTEMYALKPVEMFIPPAYHRVDALAFFGRRYDRWSGWRGEAFLPYLGLAGIAAFGWLAATGVRRLVRRQSLPAATLPIGWVLAYGAVGGVTNLLALFAGFQVFRATNRAAIFISAVVLLFAAGRLSRATVRWPAAARLALAAAIALLGAWEQLPHRERDLDPKAVAVSVAADQRFADELEAALPAGAMVFQLPVLEFPEVAPPHKLLDYEHFRPYLATRTLCFSYGAAKTRSRSRWQREVAQLPAAEMVARLESHGFAALYVNRRGYEDGGAALLGELGRLGYRPSVTDATQEQVVVRLQPAEHPTPPLAESLTFGQGWHLQPVEGVRWAYETAALSYFNPHAADLAVDLQLDLEARTEREVVFERDGEVLATWRVGPERRTLRVRAAQLAPGVNRFALRSPEAARRDPSAGMQLRTFGASAVRVAPAVRRDADRLWVDGERVAGREQ